MLKVLFSHAVSMRVVQLCSLQYVMLIVHGILAYSSARGKAGSAMGGCVLRTRL